MGSGAPPRAFLVAGDNAVSNFIEGWGGSSSPMSASSDETAIRFGVYASSDEIGERVCPVTSSINFRHK